MGLLSDSRLRVSRRGFLKASGVGAVTAAGGLGVVPYSASRAAAQNGWDAETDIVVVGSGGAAFAAAITARSLGNEVVMYEKGAYVGGTSLPSGGGSWFPNNSLMQEDGIADPRDMAIKYMARYSFPAKYNPEDETLGLPQHDFDMLSTYYDVSETVTGHLEEIGAVKWIYGQGFGPHFNEIQLDYMDHFEENVQPTHRTLHPDADGKPGGGGAMIGGYQAWAEANDMPVHIMHKVDNVIVNSSNEVIGVEISVLSGGGDEDTGTPEATPVTGMDADTSTTLSVRARKGVIFGSGGFGRNPDMMHNLMPAPYFGGCSAPTNEGDLLQISTKLGAKVGNLHNVWRNQSIFEQAVANSASYNCTWFLNGDAFMLVNKQGRRFVNEKRNYQDRPMSHNSWDANEGDWPNRLAFYIYDTRQHLNWGGVFPLPGEPENAPYIIMADTMEELSDAITTRIEELAPVVGSFKLADDFAENLLDEVATFNEYATDGWDPEFRRGAFGYDIRVPYGPTSKNKTLDVFPSPDQPNPAMYPLSDEGPYYAFIMSAAAVDTSGGPVINPDGQIIRWDDSPIEGLYGCGNAVASPGVNAYWGAGATLGNAHIWGYQAAVHATNSPEKAVD